MFLLTFLSTSLLSLNAFAHYFLIILPTLALASVARLECCAVDQRVAGLSRSWGVYEKATLHSLSHQCFHLSPFPSSENNERKCLWVRIDMMMMMMMLPTL